MNGNEGSCNYMWWWMFQILDVLSCIKDLLNKHKDAFCIFVSLPAIWQVYTCDIQRKWLHIQRLSVSQFSDSHGTTLYLLFITGCVQHVFLLEWLCLRHVDAMRLMQTQSLAIHIAREVVIHLLNEIYFMVRRHTHIPPFGDTRTFAVPISSP